MSRAVLVSTLRTSPGVSVGLYDLTRAAIAAACGAAAEVPKNGENPGTAVETPSDAVMTGYCRTAPPVEVKFVGVIAVPSAWKNILRGPSEVKFSTGFCAPPMKEPGKAVATSTAATEKAFVAAAWPRAQPAVL